MSAHISHPRYPADTKKRAKDEGRFLFTVDLDGRHVDHESGVGGSRHTMQGAASPKVATMIRRLLLEAGGMSPKDVTAHLRKHPTPGMKVSA